MTKLEEAILLLYSTQQIIIQRKLIEKMCGYPNDYGGDDLLLIAINKFLNDKEIKEIKATNKIIKQPITMEELFSELKEELLKKE